MKTKAVAYVRVSTEEQVIDGLSLDAQEEMAKAYCAMRDMDLIEIVRDQGVSAGKPIANRDGGRRVLELVRCRKATAIVAWKLDRLFRDCVDCLDTTYSWDKIGAALHLIDLGGQAVDTTSAMGRFFLTVMAGAAELERNQIRERTSAAMQHKAAKGEYTGGNARFGYRVSADGVNLEQDPAEQRIISAVIAMRSEGRSLRWIVSTLQRSGTVSRTGRPLQLQQVVNIISHHGGNA